jgi:hypothetical protein
LDLEIPQPQPQMPIVVGSATVSTFATAGDMPSQNNNNNNPDLQRIITFPGHFARRPGLPPGAPMLGAQEHMVSPLESTVFKAKLLGSLEYKLVLKVFWHALRTYTLLEQRQRQASATCAAVRSRRRLRACFIGLFIEALSSRYVALRAHALTAAHVQVRVTRPALALLLLRARKERQLRVDASAATERAASALCRRALSVGLGALLALARRARVRHVRMQWARDRRCRLPLARAFSAWYGHRTTHFSALNTLNPSADLCII